MYLSRFQPHGQCCGWNRACMCRPLTHVPGNARGIPWQGHLNTLSSVRHSSRFRVRDLDAWGLKGVVHADW
jgi:hypothetical protein